MQRKFIPSTDTISALLQGGQSRSIEDYRQKLEALSQIQPIARYDFNRGFEYGVQWALDNIEWLKKEPS